MQTTASLLQLRDKILQDNTAWEDLPEYFGHLRVVQFASDKDMEQVLESHGWTFRETRNCVLDESGLVFILKDSNEHSNAIEMISQRLRDLNYGEHKWFHASVNWILDLTPMDGALHSFRRPNVAIWGRPKCKLCPHNEWLHRDNDCHPDIVIQVCYKNSWEYERRVMEDIMKRTTTGIGYLIRTRFNDSGDKVGLDIYQVFNGDSVNKTMFCQYNHPASPTDIAPHIVIEPLDLGIDDETCPSFRIPLHHLFHYLD